MTIFWVMVVVFIVITLLIVRSIYNSPNSIVGANNRQIRQETNVNLYHEHLAQLNNDLDKGAIDQNSYQQLKNELDKTLIQDVEIEELIETKESKNSIGWPIVIVITILGLSSFTYLTLGSYSKVNDALNQSTDPHQALSSEQRLIVKIQELEQQIQEDPENASALYNLAHSYISAGAFSDAIKLLDKLMSLVGEHADILGVKAQAMYYLNQQKLTAEIQEVINKALALDAQDPATNILLGMDNFSQGKFQQAIQYWQKVVNSARQGINVQALNEAIDEAKYQMNAQQEMSGEKTDVASSSKASIILNISLSEHVTNVLNSEEDKTVFVYAIATEGPKMPLAAVKIKASDLPLTVTLDDSQAMTPQLKLSSVENVNVYAVVSMQGSAGMKSGDYKAELLNINTLQDKPLDVEISTKVP